MREETLDATCDGEAGALAVAGAASHAAIRILADGELRARVPHREMACGDLARPRADPQGDAAGANADDDGANGSGADAPE